ncbi:MFS transporter [Aspergillus melleus]|uniref:MFS transporter n=1 Tax=Aspergillus melleus TaxID=138277 RepID=UPI001E8CC459|nr:GTPase-activating protein [Aspergillus melleus]KAH8434334.1 GTPase-activating protein [Aspergillus melleus]
MSTLVQDSIFGHAVRILTNRRFFRYAEEKDPSLWHRYVNVEKSSRLAYHGRMDSVTIPEDHQLAHSETVARIPSSAWTHHGHKYQGLTGVRINPEKGKDVNVIDWWDEDDPENPQNWALSKKVFVTFQICLLTFSVYIGSAIYTPGIPTLMEEFQIAQVPATIGLTIFVAGYGLGPLLWSPMSEVPQIGRNPVYIATLIVFVALQVPTALAKNLGTLLAFRFLTGFFGSPALATGGATIADMFSPAKRAYAISIWGISAICGPVLGPLVGGFAAQAKGWTWTIWELTWLSGFALVMLIFLLPETSSANILYRRARRLRKLTGRENLKCEPEIESEGLMGKELVMITLVRPFTLNFLEPMVFLLNLYIALIYGLLYVWFESFQIVFEGIYEFNLGQQGLAYIGILVGALITIPPYFWWMHKYLEPRFDANENVAPEARLPPAIIGGCFIPICLFWFGWSARPGIHWIMPIVGSGFFSVGAFILFNCVLNYLPDAYPNYAASVLAGNDLFRSAFGAGFPLFASAMYNHLGVGWASSTLAFLSIVFIPIPLVLMKYGETLRKNYSRHARKDI